MKILAQTTQRTTAVPEAIFQLWVDIDHWADYDHGIEWAKRTDQFAEGSVYTVKPKGGPAVKATIVKIEPARRMVDVSQLLGATLQFDHLVTQEDGVTIVNIVISIEGWLGWFWAMVLGKNQQANLDDSTKNLIAKAEGRA